MSYDVIERNAQKEINMKFDSNYRGSQRSDYEQFARFLSGKQLEREKASNRYDNEGCDNRTSCDNHTGSGRPIAMVYCEWQDWRRLYDVEIGLSNGTIFEELNLPLLKTGCTGGQKGCRG